MPWLFFFKPKTAYDIHISDWSSDVCSSYLTQCSDINREISLTYQPHGSRRLVDEQGRKQHKKIEDRKAEQIARGAIAPLIPDPQGKQQKPCARRRCSHPIDNTGGAQGHRRKAERYE